MLMERAPRLLVGPEVAIDRFVADLEQAEAAQPAGHLIGTPIFAEQLLDQGPVRGTELPIAARARAPAARIRVRELGPVGPVAVGTIALDLPPDRAPVTV